MSSVKRNIVANYFGSAWSALMGMALVPQYIRYLGIESYGLIGVFALLNTVLTLLDLGLAPTLSRELARYKAGSHTPQSIRDLVRSIEVFYITIAVTFGLGVVIGAPWLATKWLRNETIPTSTVITSLMITGGVIAVRWLGSLYRSGIVGMQQQVWLNGSNIVFSTLRGLGVLAVLAWLSPTIQAFFAYQGLISALETLVLGAQLRRMLPRSGHPARFHWNAIRQVGRFAAGMTAIALLSLLLMQVDKFMLSTLLPLKQFGYYTLAGTVAGGLSMMVGPISMATYPRLAELVALGHEDNLTATYHKFCQLVAITIIPTAIVLSLFSRHILLLWTRNEEATHSAAPLVSVLAIGTMANSLMHTPYGLQLAHGWTRFAIIQNIIAVTLLVPAVYFGVSTYGAIASALVWAALNIAYVTISVPFMHRKLLPTQMWRWYRDDVSYPLVAVLGPALVVRSLTPSADLGSPIKSALVVVCASAVSLCGALTATPLGRQYIARYFHPLRRQVLRGLGRR